MDDADAGGIWWTRLLRGPADAAGRRRHPGNGEPGSGTRQLGHRAAGYSPDRGDVPRTSSPQRRLWRVCTREPPRKIAPDLTISAI